MNQAARIEGANDRRTYEGEDRMTNIAIVCPSRVKQTAGEELLYSPLEQGGTLATATAPVRP